VKYSLYFYFVQYSYVLLVLLFLLFTLQNYKLFLNKQKITYTSFAQPSSHTRLCQLTDFPSAHAPLCQLADFPSLILRSSFAQGWGDVDRYFVRYYSEPIASVRAATCAGVVAHEVISRIAVCSLSMVFHR